MTVATWVSFDCFGTLIDWQTGFRPLLGPIGGDRVDELVHAYHQSETNTHAVLQGCAYLNAAHAFGIRGVWVDHENTVQDDSICAAHIHDMATLPATLRSFNVV